MSTQTKDDLTTKVAARIVDHIREQKLMPGDRLPTARTMATSYSVATPTVREALRRLEATGVIDIKHGSGIYLRGDVDRTVIVNPVPLAGHQNERLILDLLDARQQIEPPLARRAAMRATGDDITDLRTLLDEAATFLDFRDELLGPTNMSFHISIAHVAGNLILAHVMESLVELYISEQFDILYMFDARSRDHADHLQILEAIESHDPDLAEARMAAHLAEIRHVVAEAMQSPPVSG